ncbi:sugar ABC transporter ATP-binding protein [Yinghuangia sp. ASG 101]|uniref:sugar ABC transporter ATP-binding protein n=1 Tax=Yinghuangia sp. ASG 101 TaxID=2896848 RepID=UPI001E4C200F|nr:sugar ABC transporter ATP-binding protein [Yinghuangia sp. ASG 101]UGQ12969.1 sugar ABC transporter ATP-binding protein [Yinghuangia sp. ASG 101]
MALRKEPATPFLQVAGISKSFPGVRALHNVSLDLAAGEVHALTGENGSGKSTLSKIIGGVHQADAGTILLDGAPVAIPNPAAALRLGIVSISQELTLATSLSVAENIYLGRLPRTRFGAVDWRKLRRDARAVLDDLHVHVDERATVSTLSIELRQEVEIARALSTDARLLILDEATSSLSEAATARLLEVVEEQRRRGVAVLMISHRMPELYRSASRATVLRDGEPVATVPLPETPEPELVRLMVGRDLEDYYGSREAVAGEVALEVRDLTSTDGRLGRTSFTVRRGRVLGVAGLVGSGKTELGLALGGVLASRGDVLVGGTRVSVANPRAALAGGIGFVPDDRKGQCILPGRSVAENFALAWMDDLSAYGVRRVREERRRVEASMDRYGVVAAHSGVRISTLSGGNQQKVILGRLFARGCDVYVLCEPTRGVDVGAKSAIYRLIQELASQGAAFVIISSELPELLGLADEIMVYHHGEVHGHFDVAGLDEETVASVAVSGRVPSLAA